MSITKVRQLPVRDKIEMMEILWEDSQSRVDAAPVPEAHRRLLDERRTAVEAGTEEVLEWDAVKDAMRAGMKRLKVLRSAKCDFADRFTSISTKFDCLTRSIVL